MKRVVRLFGIISLLVLSAILFSFGKVSAADKFPPAQGFINDYAQVLSPEGKAALENLSRNLEQKTKAELAIAIIPDMGGSDVESYAVKLFEQWNIGKKGKDNGVLILVAIKEHKVRIEVGYGLEGTIPDGLVGEVIRYMTPAFKSNEFDKGLLEGASFIASRIAKEAGVKLDTPVDTESLPIGEGNSGYSIQDIFVLLLFFVVAPFFWIANLLARRRNQGYWSSGYSGGGLGGFGGGFGSGGFGGGGGFGGFGGGGSGGGGSSGSW